MTTPINLKDFLAQIKDEDFITAFYPSVAGPKAFFIRTNFTISEPGPMYTFDDKTEENIILKILPNAHIPGEIRTSGLNLIVKGEKSDAMSASTFRLKCPKI